MPGEVIAIATAVTSVSNLVDGILSRADRDMPDKELDENLSKIQEAFALNSVDSDEFRAFIDKLFRTAGCTIAPTGNISMGRREFTHTALVLAAQLIHERRLAARAFRAKE